MATVAISGSDTISLNNRVLVDLADDDVFSLKLPNDIMTVKTGKNGNSIFGVNETGKVGEFEVRVIRGSSDDKFLNNLLSQQQANPAGFVLMIGEFIKKIGDGQGNIASDQYLASSGVFQKIPEAKSNVAGDSGQSVTTYMLKFANIVRVIS